MENQPKLADAINRSVPYDKIKNDLQNMDLASPSTRSNLTPLMHLITLVDYYHHDYKDTFHNFKDNDEYAEEQKLTQAKILELLVNFELENPGRINVGASYDTFKNGKYVKETAFNLLIKYLINNKKNPSYVNKVYYATLCNLLKIEKQNIGSINMFSDIDLLHNFIVSETTNYDEPSNSDAINLFLDLYKEFYNKKESKYVDYSRHYVDSISDGGSYVIINDLLDKIVEDTRNQSRVEGLYHLDMLSKILEILFFTRKTDDLNELSRKYHIKSDIQTESIDKKIIYSLVFLYLTKKIIKVKSDTIMAATVFRNSPPSSMQPSVLQSASADSNPSGTPPSKKPRLMTPDKSLKNYASKKQLTRATLAPVFKDMMTPFLKPAIDNQIHYFNDDITEEQILSYVENEEERIFLSDIFNRFSHISKNRIFPPMFLGGYSNKKSYKRSHKRCHKRKSKKNIKKSHH